MADIEIDDTVDITDVVCPVTFVKAKVALEELDDGQILAIKMNDGEPVQNVPRSVKEEGHQILKLEDNEDGTYTLIVRKVEEQENREMTITVAGNKKEYEDGLKLTELIEKEDIESPEYVTVTINDEFISKADVSETEVKDGDVVEFLYYMGGGAR